MSQYDLLALQYGPTPAQPLAMQLTPGLGVTGIESAAQRWLQMLLTIQGSVPGDPLYGTTFMSEILGGRVQTNDQVLLAYNTALQQIQSYERQFALTYPPDQTITDASMTFDLQPGTLKLFIDLTTAAGTRRQVIAPVSLLA